MNEYFELLIGFDAREDFLNFTDIWDIDRIRLYLLREDIIKPLSVDVMVWDAIIHALQVVRPDWVGPRQEIWDSLEKLREFITEKNLSRPYWIVAVSQWVTSDKKKALEALYVDYVKPIPLSHGWHLLGFDVADDFLLSGLMNAGYKGEEGEILNRQWAKHLNHHHLFDDLNTALQYKELTDERVQEHSPFNVYGIYLIEKISGCGLGSK